MFVAVQPGIKSICGFSQILNFERRFGLLFGHHRLSRLVQSGVSDRENAATIVCAQKSARKGRVASEDDQEAELLETQTAGMVSLDAKQYEAVNAPDGPILVEGAPGTGKTLIVCQRLANLLKRKKIDAGSVLVFTLTRRAADEMWSDVARIVGDGRARALTAVGTFQAICAGVLREHANKLGLHVNFLVYGIQEQTSVLVDIMKHHGLDVEHVGAVRDQIAEWKATLKSYEETESGGDSEIEQIAGRVFREYDERLRHMNVVDKNDLCRLAVELFTTYPEVIQQYRSQWRYVFCDVDLSDLTPAELSVLKELGTEYRNIFAVDDPSRWQDGHPAHQSATLAADFPDLQRVRLDQNYRNTATVLEAAEALINAPSKPAFNNRGAGNPIVVFEAENDDDEAEFVLREAAKLISSREVRRSEIAVLFRAREQAEALETAFDGTELPYRLLGGTSSVFRKQENLDIVAYLRLIYNPLDELSIRRIINVPPRGVPDSVWPEIKQWSASTGRPIFLALRSLAEHPDRGAHPFPARVIKGLVAFNNTMVQLVKGSRKRNVLEIAQLVVERTGYAQFLEDHYGEKLSKVRWDNIDDLLYAIERYVPLGDQGLPEFLHDVALMTEADEREAGIEAVTMMSMDAARGSQFKAVFMVGLEDQVIPGKDADTNPAVLEEGRTLMYTSMLRASDRLSFSYSGKRYKGRGALAMYPSRFIDEIPAEFLVRKRSSEMAEEYEEGAARREGDTEVDDDDALPELSKDLEAVLNAQVDVDEDIESFIEQKLSSSRKSKAAGPSGSTNGVATTSRKSKSAGGLLLPPELEDEEEVVEDEVEDADDAGVVARPRAAGSADTKLPTKPKVRHVSLDQIEEQEHALEEAEEEEDTEEFGVRGFREVGEVPQDDENIGLEDEAAVVVGGAVEEEKEKKKRPRNEFGRGSSWKEQDWPFQPEDSLNAIALLNGQPRRLPESLMHARRFQPGERVTHWRYGLGTVVNCVEDKNDYNDTEIVVRFDGQDVDSEMQASLSALMRGEHPDKVIGTDFRYIDHTQFANPSGIDPTREPEILGAEWTRTFARQDEEERKRLAQLALDEADEPTPDEDAAEGPDPGAANGSSSQPQFEFRKPMFTYLAEESAARRAYGSADSQAPTAVEVFLPPRLAPLGPDGKPFYPGQSLDDLYAVRVTDSGAFPGDGDSEVDLSGYGDEGDEDEDDEGEEGDEDLEERAETESTDSDSERTSDE